MELGQNQKLWIEALRSGSYLQCKDELYHDGDNSYCCLGVANTMFNLNAQDNETLDGTNYKEVLGLRDACGEIHYDDYDDEDEQDVSECLSLIEMNDCGKSFIDIADFIEANPQLVFTHSV